MEDDLKTTLYQTLSTSYNAINDWRGKLLGFLPLASGAGIFYLLSIPGIGKNNAITSNLLPIGIVGALVTIGLFVYDLRAIQVRRGLIEAGAEIEKASGINGQFSSRPHSLVRLVNDLLGSTLIYSAIFAGWLFFGLAFSAPQAAWIVAIIGFLFCFIVTIGGGAIIAYRQK
jgi:hypothetical protein